MTKPAFPALNATLRRLRRHRDMALLAGLFALMLAGLVGLAAATGWRETAGQLGRLSAAEISTLLLLSLGNYGLRAARWHLFSRQLGVPTQAAQNLRYYLGGFAMAVTPGRVGELVRMRWINRETGWAFERTAPLALVDRSSDLAAMGVILGLSLGFSTLGMRGALPVAALAVLAAWVATRPALLAALAGLGYRLTGRAARLFVRVRRASRSLGSFRSPRLLLLATALGVIGWAAEGYAFYLLLGWMDAGTTLPRAMTIFTFATLAGGLTGAPGGLGGAEAAMIALLTFDGVPIEVAIAATAVIRVTTLWFAIGIGLLFFPTSERSSGQVGNALEQH